MQNSGPWDPWLLVVENSRCFAQRGHSAGTVHGAPPSYASSFLELFCLCFSAHGFVWV